MSRGHFGLARSTPGTLSLPDEEGLAPCVGLVLHSVATYGQKDGSLMGRGLPESSANRTVCTQLCSAAGHRDSSPGAHFCSSLKVVFACCVAPSVLGCTLALLTCSKHLFVLFLLSPLHPPLSVCQNTNGPLLGPCHLVSICHPVTASLPDQNGVLWKVGC